MSETELSGDRLRELYDHATNLSEGDRVAFGSGFDERTVTDVDDGGNIVWVSFIDPHGTPDLELAREHVFHGFTIAYPADDYKPCNKLGTWENMHEFAHVTDISFVDDADPDEPDAHVSWSFDQAFVDQETAFLADDDDEDDGLRGVDRHPDATFETRQLTWSPDSDPNGDHTYGQFELVAKPGGAVVIKAPNSECYLGRLDMSQLSGPLRRQVAEFIDPEVRTHHASQPGHYHRDLVNFVQHALEE